ncbi:hypothetical protein FACS189498_3120 [Spirochaetia bacterium]|nr:hypothetical protein FACS189498_3120 [Spirochaetia bacterium]
MTKKTSLSFPVLFAIYGNMILYGFIQSIRGIALPLIKNELGFSYSRQGLILLLISVVLVLACLSAGAFISRFSFKKALMLGFLAVMLGMGVFFFSNSFWAATGVFLIIQVGLSYFEIGINGMGSKFFTVKAGLMMNLLHFCYGIGAIAGPRFAGFISTLPNAGTRYIYPAGIPFVFIMMVITLLIRFSPEASETVDTEKNPENIEAKKMTFLNALRQPVAWGFGIILGLSGTVEAGFVNWSVLYLQDVYQYDPALGGAAFISFYFILYTFARLFGGFFIEKIGYVNSLFLASISIFVILAAGFVLGERGIWALPFSGIFISIFWPTMLAVNISVFKENAQVVSSAMLPIAFTLSGLCQYGVGLINRFAGPSWGFRSCLVSSLILCAAIYKLRIYMKKTKSISSAGPSED